MKKQHQTPERACALQQISCIILACTHFLPLKSAMHRCFGEQETRGCLCSMAISTSISALCREVGTDPKLSKTCTIGNIVHVCFYAWNATRLLPTTSCTARYFPAYHLVKHSLPKHSLPCKLTQPNFCVLLVVQRVSAARKSLVCSTSEPVVGCCNVTSRLRYLPSTKVNYS